MFESSNEIDTILNALGEQLSALGSTSFELVVCGGSALNALGLVHRTTRDVDVLAFLTQAEKGKPVLQTARPFPEVLDQAAAKVSRDFNLPTDWLNSGPTSA